MKVMLDCKQIARLISDGLDQPLPVAERAQMRLHFVMCRGCRTVHEQMSFMRRAMRQLGQQELDNPQRAGTDQFNPRSGEGLSVPDDQDKGRPPCA